MDDGEIDISDQGLPPNPYPSSSLDSFLDEFLKNSRTCTHTHTCNPPGPDSADTHTHTCYHTHTRLFPSGGETPVGKSQRPLGNREAVRKYRERKKAHTAYLEEEVKKLRVLNQHLVGKLQEQAILEAKILQLREVLMDVRGKIDGELGVSGLENKCDSTASFEEGGCGVDSNGSAWMGLECGNDVPCFHPDFGASMVAGGGGKVAFSWEKNCQPAVVDCQTNTSDVVSAEEN